MHEADVNVFQFLIGDIQCFLHRKILACSRLINQNFWSMMSSMHSKNDINISREVIVETSMKKVFLFSFLFTLHICAECEVFRFSFANEETQKISSVVKEDVYINGEFSHNSEIVNRIVSRVVQTKKDVATERDTALYSVTFMTSEKAKNGMFTWGRELTSIFWRDDLGRYTISDQYFMPIVRNVPVFPERDVKLGETWQNEATEAYDFSEVFGIRRPVIAPFKINYKYVGKEVKGTQTLHIIEAKYQKEYDIPQKVIKEYRRKNSRGQWPVKTNVRSEQKIAWNAQKGLIASYHEDFTIAIFLNTGEEVTYIGTSYANTEEIIRKEVEASGDEVKKQIESLHLENTTIQKTEKGLKIIIENIQFEPNSAVLQDSEKEKLKKIALVLKEHSKGDLLVEGHAVFSSTRQRQQEVSEERALAVGNYLVKLGARAREHIFTRGLGAAFPLFPNTNEENKAKNRRVEITIIE